MKTRRFCPRCGRPLLKSHNDAAVNGYTFQCFACDEDFFRFEVLRKNDLELVHELRQKTLQYEIANGIHTHTIHKPYPKQKVLF